MRGPIRRAGHAVVLFVAVFGTSTAAWGAFTDQASGSLTLQTATLQPPTQVTTARGLCVIGLADAIVVSWLPSPTPGVDGYEVLRATAATGPYAPVGTTTTGVHTYTDSSLPFSTTFYYVVRSFTHSWRSPDTAPVSRKTAAGLCL